MDGRGAQTQGSSLTVRALAVMTARTLSFTLGFVLPLLLVRRLSQTDLGLYRQVFLLVNSAVNLLPLGFHMSAFYFLPRETDAPARQGQIVLNVTLFFAVVAALGGLLLALRPHILSAIFHSTDLVPYAPLIGLLIFLWVYASQLEYIALANQEVRLATLFIVALQLSRTLLLLGAALVFNSVHALIWAAIIQGVVQACVLLGYLGVRFRLFSCKFDPALLKTQLSYALPLGFASLLYAFQLDVHSYFVSHRYGVAAFAVYSIGCFDLPLITILSDSVGAAMIPRVTFLQKENRRHEIVVLTARMMRKLAAVYFPAYVLLLIVARAFILFLFTPRYLASYPIFVVNLTMILIYFMSNIYDPVMRAYAEHRYFLLRLRAVLLCVLLLALWLGTVRFGLVGVISIVVAINLCERLVAVTKAARIVGVTRADLPLLRDVGKVAVASLAAGGAALVARAALANAPPFFVLAGCGLVFGGTYLAALLLLRVLTPDEREQIQRRVAALKRRTLWRRAADNPA